MQPQYTEEKLPASRNTCPIQKENTPPNSNGTFVNFAEGVLITYAEEIKITCSVLLLYKLNKQFTRILGGYCSNEIGIVRQDKGIAN